MNKKNGKLPKWAIFLIIGLSVFVAMPMFLIFGLCVYGIVTEDFIDNNLVIEKTVEGYYNDKTNTYIITGYVKNISDDDASDIEISYVLYDKDNNIIGNASTYLEELEEGKTWKFTASYIGSDAKDITHFSLKDLSTFDSIY